MKTIEHHFPTLEAPSGGLARLSARLDQSSRRTQLHPAAALAIVLGLLISTPWLLDSAQSRLRQSEQLGELRRTLAEHQRPDLSINGQKPGAVKLGSDQVEAYFISGGG